ncbi:hypothetical protein GQ53DRAFT_801261 [Thozetella sp. PMI_491]|nr:hypothetical protein GQ53DRAFT_801261 [Thozetella sp. PMI_491]
MFYSWPTNAFVYPAAENVLFALVLGFTGPTSWLRYAGLAAMITLSYLMFQTLVLHPFQYSFFNSILGGLSWALVLHYLDFAILSAWTFEANGPTSTLGGLAFSRPWPPASDKGQTARRGGFLQRFSFGFALQHMLRLPATPWQVKGVPPFSRRDPKYVPTRTAAITSSGIAAGAFFLILDAVGTLGGDTSQNPILFGPGKVPFFSRLSEVSAEEVIIRNVGTVMYWFMSYSVMQFLYNSFAFFALLLGLNGPESWPPLFGNFVDCWSIRQFHGVCWHQQLRQLHNGPVSFLCGQVLGLRSGGLINRYTAILLSFLDSGLLHVFSEIGDGLPYAMSGCMRFWAMHACGIMLEDGVQAVYRSMSSIERTNREPELWERLVGYIWTFA